MVDEDYFEDFNRRRPRRQTYRGSYRNPGSSQFFDPSADILAGIKSVEKTISDRKTAVRDFENAAALKRQETLNSIRDTDSMSDTTAIDSLQQQLMNEVDELYKLDIASFEGDRSAYLKKASEVNKIVKTIPALMGLIDAEGETLKENQSSSQDFFKKLLRSNDPNYYDFVDAASKGGPGVSFRMQNGNIIAQLNGKDIFNGNAYVKAKKDGFDLVKYAGDYTPQINEADALASKGLNALVSKEVIEKVNKGIELVGEEKTNYTLAKQKYEERLRSGNIPIPVNESTYQMFTNYGISDSDKKDPWGKDLQMQEGATREAVIQHMIDQKFPEDVVTTKTTIKPGMTLAQQKAEQRAGRQINLAEQKFQYEKQLDASNKAEFESGIDFYLNRNLDHARKMREKGLFEPNKINTKPATDKIAKLLGEGSAFTYKSLEGEIVDGKFEPSAGSGEFFVIDPEGQVVEGANTPVGLVDLLNQGTIYAQLKSAPDASKAAKYVGSRMKDISKKSTPVVKTNADISDLEPGTIVMFKGKERVVFIDPDSGKKAVTSIDSYNKKYK